MAFSGFNIVRYCCDGCADAGILVVAGKSCHTIHHEKADFTMSCCEKDLQNQCEKANKNCEILRIQTDIPTLVVNNLHQQYDSALSFEFTNATLCFLYKHTFSTELSVNYLLDKKVFRSGRDILTRHAVLIC